MPTKKLSPMPSKPARNISHLVSGNSRIFYFCDIIEELMKPGAHFYNTLTRKKELFETINPPEVGLYTCGPTVYLYAHIGNFRTYIFEDILRRVLEYNGYKVKHVMNITDVGHLFGDRDMGRDKVEEQARKEQKSAWEVAELYTQAFRKDMERLNILEPTVWCKATEHIPEMIALVKRLEDRGFTYQTSDGIYFDTSKLPDYGKLAHLDIEGLREGARVEVNPEKKNPTDFALWKFSPKDRKRQMEWKSPWGLGYPGWHIECSAMSLKYLGETFDIHTGGVDHIPVHHTNEIAQSEAATGKKFVNFWLHGEFLVLEEGRMGKSEGRIVTISELEGQGFTPLAFRYLCLMAHYRSPLKFSEDGLQAAQTALLNLKREIYYWDEPSEPIPEYEEKFLAAINDDLNMPRAVALVWDLVKSDYPTAKKHATVLKWDRALGLRLDKPFVPVVKEISLEELPPEVKELVERREEFRREEKFEEADKLRGEIAEMGYTVEDTPKGPRLFKLG